MARTDAYRSPQERAEREAHLQAMREKYRRHPPRSQRKATTERHTPSGRVATRPQSWKPRELAHAIRMAAKIAKEERDSNPFFVEALEIAATYFDEL